jgi:prepilin-type N-terminal cleavage/methylation domain-containing protein
LKIRNLVIENLMKIVNYKLKIAEQKGFSLMELMIVIAITGILVATVLVNSGRNPDRDVRLEKDRLMTFLRDVQNMSLSAEQPSETGASDCYNVSGEYICSLCGYGIKKDDSGNIQAYYVKKAAVDDVCSALAGDTGEDYTVAIFRPKNDVTISGLETSDKIFFLIPNGSVYDGGSPMSEDKVITLSKTDISSTADVDVTITPGGVVK